MSKNNKKMVKDFKYLRPNIQVLNDLYNKKEDTEKVVLEPVYLDFDEEFEIRYEEKVKLVEKDFIEYLRELIIPIYDKVYQKYTIMDYLKDNSKESYKLEDYIKKCNDELDTIEEEDMEDEYDTDDYILTKKNKKKYN